MIAALGNLYIGGMRGCKPEARRIVIWNVSRAFSCKCQTDITADGINSERPTSNDKCRTISIGCRAFFQNFLHNLTKLRDLIQSDERVDFRHFLSQFARKPLRHAAAYDEFLIGSLVQAALLVRLQNRFN